MSTVKVSINLRAILNMTDRLEARALDLANSPIMPGGDAMVNLAHVANFETWARRNDLSADELANYEDPDELWSPFQILRFWSEQWRVIFAMDYEDPAWRPTLRTEAAFLINADVLTWAWDHEVHFDDFAADVRSARARLEGILREGERPDRIRVVCPDCDSGKRLIIRYAKAKVVGHACRCCGAYRPASADPLPRCPNLWCWSVAPPIEVTASDERDDTWKCPACKHRFDAAAVRRAHAKQLRSEGAARWVRLADAVSILRKQGWRDDTIRDWADGEQVEVATDDTGSLFVWWPDIWRRHLAHRQERDNAKREMDERAARKAVCAEEHGEDCWADGHQGKPGQRGCARSLDRMTAV